jgi:hypothetical protein
MTPLITSYVAKNEPTVVCRSAPSAAVSRQLDANNKGFLVGRQNPAAIGARRIGLELPQQQRSLA